ncbi:hypothetical protein QGM71_02600 [Virgibacillus sp. C22-A2]|uniref:NTP pyrophosphohydrolase MazG putative catalytic core domain-containing protein n=1 Tax=Virgibacillus tibetensis TaxID=3042313 RepID=A0ABU6KB76_9BACI|nr:hypothetical protein [Virgibacillus sp. C22-A2]
MNQQPIYKSINKLNYRTKVLNDINRERDRQFYLYGEQKDINFPLMFAILSEEIGEVAQAIQSQYEMDSVKETDSDNLYRELIQVAAVAVKMAERLVPDEVPDE